MTVSLPYTLTNGTVANADQVMANFNALKIAFTNPSYFNVMDYGAVGDGYNDDTTAIQSAINAAVAVHGGIVYLPIGTYLISAPLDFEYDGVGMVGAGWNNTIIQTSANVAAGITLAQNHRQDPGGVFADFWLKGTPTNAGGILVGSTSYYVSNTHFLRVKISHFTGTDAYGIRLRTCYEMDFQDVILYYNYNNINVPSTCSVSSTMFCGFASYNGLATNIGALLEGTIIDIHFRDMVFESNAKEAIRSLGAGTRLFVVGCYFEDNMHSGSGDAHIYMNGTSGANHSCNFTLRDLVIIQPAYIPVVKMDYAIGVIENCRNLPEYTVTTTANSDIRNSRYSIMGNQTLTSPFTLGYELRSVYVLIRNGTNADTVKPSVDYDYGYWNGDLIAEENNIGKGASGTNYSLSASGAVLTLKPSGFSGTPIVVISATLKYYKSATINLVVSPSCQTTVGIGLYFRNSLTGNDVDLAALVDTGEVDVYLSYLTAK